MKRDSSGCENIKNLGILVTRDGYAKMWRMALCIRHNCGERENIVGHRCIRPLITSFIWIRGSTCVLFEWSKGLRSQFIILEQKKVKKQHPLLSK